MNGHDSEYLPHFNDDAWWLQQDQDHAWQEYMMELLSEEEEDGSES